MTMGLYHKKTSAYRESLSFFFRLWYNENINPERRNK